MATVGEVRIGQTAPITSSWGALVIALNERSHSRLSRLIRECGGRVERKITPSDDAPILIDSVPSFLIIDGSALDAARIVRDVRRQGYAGGIVCTGLTNDLEEEAKILDAGANWFIGESDAAGSLLLVFSQQSALSAGPRAYAVRDSFWFVPAQRTLVAEGKQHALTALEYDLLVVLADSFGRWVPLRAVGNQLGWHFSDQALLDRTKELLRRIRRRLGYRANIYLKRDRGMCWGTPE